MTKSTDGGEVKRALIRPKYIIWILVVIAFLWVQRLRRVNSYSEYCYNPEAYPVLTRTQRNAEPKYSFATRLMPSRLSSGMMNSLIQSMVEHDVLTTANRFTIFVDSEDYECLGDDVRVDRHELHRWSTVPALFDRLNITAPSSTQTECLMKVFSHSLAPSLSELPNGVQIHVSQLPPSARKSLILDMSQGANKNHVNEVLLNIDFLRVMEQQRNVFSDTDIMFWVEDDVTVTRNFLYDLQKGLDHGYHFYSPYSPYHGVTYDYGTCLVGFTPEGLTKFAHEVDITLGYRPLDMVLKQFHQREVLQCVPSCADHNFELNSTVRSTSVVPSDPSASYPPVSGYPFGYHHITNTPSQAIKWARYKAWELYNHSKHHFMTGNKGDWTIVAKRNLMTCHAMIE